MTGRIHVIPPHLLLTYTQTELQQAAAKARHLLQRRKPENLDFDPKGNPSFEQAKRTVLMERMVLVKFGVEDGFDTYRHLFMAYPNPLTNVEAGVGLPFRGHALRMSFTIEANLEDPAQIKAVLKEKSLKIKAVNSKFEHEAIREIHPINADEELDQIMVKATSYALTEFVFRWCLNVSDELNEKKNILRAALIREIDPIRHRLSYHAEYLEPVQYFLVESLIINPRTRFPFNVPQQSFPRPAG